MKLSLARRFRFSWLGKILFNMKWSDYILRRLFLNKFTEKYYNETTKNWQQINHELNSILKKYKGFLGHGAALSIIRDKQIKFNQDLDYDIYYEKNEKQLFSDIEKLGFKIIQKTYWNNQLTMFIIEKEKCYIDFFVINFDKEKNKYYICTTSYEYNKNYFEKCDQKDWYKTNKAILYKRFIPHIRIEKEKIDNNEIYLPENYYEYFNYLYGYDWETPKRYFNWKLEPKNNRLVKVKDNIEMFVSKENLKNIFE